MTFNHFVKKYTKAVFLFIAIMMVVPLVLWGSFSPSTKGEDVDEQAATLLGTSRVTRGEYRAHIQKAVAGYYWKNPWTMFRRDGPGPREDEISTIAWENIVLLHDARDKGVEATYEEYVRQLHSVHSRIMEFMRQRFAPFSEEQFDQIGLGLFKTQPAMFREWVRDLATIEKLLNLVSEGTFADYDKVYDEVLKSQQMARAWYASFDPKDFERLASAPKAEEVAKYFEQNKARFKVPDKIQLAYLMAETDVMKKTVTEPTDAEIEQHYKETRAEYLIPESMEHQHPRGELHNENEAKPEPKYKPLSEVRDQVIDRRKTAKAQEAARKAMEIVNVDLGEAVKDGKYPPEILESLQAKYKGQVSLTLDLTTGLSQKQFEDLEKAVGKSSKLAEWSFEAARKDGDVSDLITTDKGVAVFKVQRKVASYQPDLTGPVRRQIEEVLGKEQVRKRTSQVANNVVADIGKSGFAAARQKYPLEWKSTRYFKAQGGDAGVEEAGLGRAIASQVSRKQLQTGKAAVLAGTLTNDREKADWSFVAYLEDVVSLPPDDIEKEFASVREDKNEEARIAAKQKHTTHAVETADIRKADWLKKEEEKFKKPEPPKTPPMRLQPPVPK